MKLIETIKAYWKVIVPSVPLQESKRDEVVRLGNILKQVEKSNKYKIRDFKVK